MQIIYVALQLLPFFILAIAAAIYMYLYCRCQKDRGNCQYRCILKAAIIASEHKGTAKTTTEKKFQKLNQIRMLIKLFQFKAFGCQVLWSRASTH